eukprot:3741155-Amphidinium_carterae.2
MQSHQAEAICCVGACTLCEEEGSAAQEAHLGADVGSPGLWVKVATGSCSRIQNWEQSGCLRVVKGREGKIGQNKCALQGRFQRGESLQSEQTTPPRCQSCGSLSSLASDTSTALPSIPTP